jgi:hypothetical protein
MQQTKRIRVVRLAVSLLVAIAVLAPGTAEAAFTTPQDLSGAGAFAPQVAVDTDGDGLTVWKGSDGSFFRAQARARSAAGILGPVETLSAAGRSAFEPGVAVDGGGDGLTVWRRRDGIAASCSNNYGCFRIQARARSAAGVLATTQTLSPADQHADQPQVAIDANGNALVVWRRGDGTGSCHAFGCYRIQARARSAAGTLGSVQTLSVAGEDAGTPQVVIDADGDALVVWTRPDGTGACSGDDCQRIQARARAAAGTLGPLLTLSAAGQNATDPQVAGDPSGDALVVWRRFDGSNWRIQARAHSAAGVLGAVQALSGLGATAERPQVAIDADGDALVVWRNFDDGAIRARARSSAGVLAAVQTLSPPGQNAVEPQVASEADGDAVAVWGRFDAIGGTCSPSSFGCIRAEARTRSAAGTLGSVQTLSASGQHVGDPQVAAAADAFALAVWRYGPGEGQGCCAGIQAAAGP